jgi:hypothetical protein
MNLVVIDRFPQQLYFILVSVYTSIPKWPGTPYVYLISYFFAMSNSMYNPFLYCCMNNRQVRTAKVDRVAFTICSFWYSRFRDGFRSVFSCYPCVSLSSTYSPQAYATRRSFCEPTALSVVYSCQRRSQTMSVTNSRVSRISDSSVNFNRTHWFN